jgi:hypothetical protein
MPSTFSPSLKIELIANGEQAGTWGATTNNNLGTLIEQAIAGVDTINIAGLTTYTLSNYNGIYDEARNAGLIFTGALTANCTVFTPAVEKLYVISNQTTGGYYITVTSGSGSNISVASGTNQLMYCDGTNYNTAISNINNVAGDLTVTGSIVLGANLTSTTGNLTLNAYSNVVNMGFNTGALIAPIGTTAQRPTNLVNGMVRWNTTTSAYEVYTGSTWINILTSNYTVNYLIVGGGGSGGPDAGGGGGAGGFLTSTSTLVSGTSYTVTIGSGGSSSNGGNSAISNVATAVGGGAGGSGQGNGSNGGSGGGGGYGYLTISPTGGSATSGQGNSGGSSADGYGGAGGGGASAAGSFGGSSSNGGNGGSGSSSSISGTTSYYAGGGGGGGVFGGTGSGASGGGGNGGSTGNIGGAGTANTGGGGGASGGTYFSGGGAGGSGIVIISYPGTQRGTGGTITTAANNTIHTFTSSGTYVA